MDNLETQVAKLQIGNFKQTSTFVSLLAEKSSSSGAELFAVCELPLLNPAATSDCQRITSSLEAALKRAFRHTATEHTFETALSDINEELAKLTDLGQANWLGKLGAVIAAKVGSRFYIATTGKVSAFLLRDGAVNSLADSPKENHPLKSFANFAVGKLMQTDMVILSTPQLFNYLSLERVDKIMQSHALPIAAQEIVRLLEDNAGPEVAFGTILLAQAEEGSVADTAAVAEATQTNPSSNSWQSRATGFAKSLHTQHVAPMLKKAQSFSSKPPKVDVKNLFSESQARITQTFKNSQAAAAKLGVVRSWTLKKKIILGVVLGLALLIVVTLVVNSNRKQNAEANAAKQTIATRILENINTANSNILYGDEASAGALVPTIKTDLEELRLLDPERASEIDKDVTTLQNKLEHKTEVNPEHIATLSSSSHLISLPNFLATSSGSQVVAYNISTGQVVDGAIKSDSPLEQTVATKDSAVVFDGQGLKTWQPTSGQFGSAFFQNVPRTEQLAGMDFYPDNNRIYLIDKDRNQITTFLVASNSISRPTVWLKTETDLSTAQDLAIDGSLYVYFSGSIAKFALGEPAAFDFPVLAEPLSNNGKIFTNKSTNLLYVLDSGNGRILILEKTGKLQQILTSSQLKDAQDFTVREDLKKIFILKDGSLYTIPL